LDLADLAVFLEMPSVAFYPFPQTLLAALQAQEPALLAT
jgi:hypothetical protein